MAATTVSRPSPASKSDSSLEVALAVWHRWKRLALVIFLIPFGATVGMVRALPDVYEATTTLLVGHTQLDLDHPTDVAATSGLDTRLRTINEQILSRARLMQVIARYDLYADDGRGATLDERAERLRRDVRVGFKEIRDQLAWRTVTIAVSITVRGRDPETAAAVANGLAGLYVEENAKQREQQVSAAAEFLSTQLDDAKGQLEVQELRLSQFKERHVGELPEHQVMNLSALERLRGRLGVIADAERTSRDRGDQREVEALSKEADDVRRAITGYEQRVRNAAQTELELQQRMRDYDAARQRYQSLLQRYGEAQLAERLGRRTEIQQLRILDPAVVPPRPVAPRRIPLFLMGAMVSAVVAAAASMVVDARDTSFHSIDDLRAVTRVPVLVSIPPIVTPRDAWWGRGRYVLGVLITSGAVVAVLKGAAHVAHDNLTLVRLLSPGVF